MNDLFSQIDKLLIEAAVSKINEERAASKNGRVPHKFMENILQALQDRGVKVTRDSLQAKCRRLREKRESGMPSNIAVAGEESVISGVSCSIVANSASPISSRDRPNETTVKAKQDLKLLKKKAIDKVAVAYKLAIQQKDANRSRLPKGTLEMIIESTKRELGIEANADFKIPVKTIHNRMGRANITPKHTGSISPLEPIEDFLVRTIMQMAKIGQPMRANEVVEFVNSTIDGSIHQSRLVEWKKKQLPYKSEKELGTIGIGYYNQFMKRYKSILEGSAKGRRLFPASQRSVHWMDPECLEQMFDSIYAIWVQAGVAQELSTPIAYDITGNFVPIGSSDQYGLPSNIIITHKDYILFGDEIVLHTRQKEDGPMGGHGDGPNPVSNVSDHRTTLLPFTSAAGEVVVVAIVFQSDSDEIDPSWHTGIDIMVDNANVTADGSIDGNNPENYGPGTCFPSGPVCKYRGKEIPTLTFTSANGSITSDILVKIFKYLDDIELFPRGGSNKSTAEPCVIVDGHVSRLAPTTFLNYINDPKHRWNFALGVPNITKLWQDGDYSKQTDTFKVYWKKAKDELTTFKIQWGMDHRLDASDVIPCLNKAYAMSFQNVANNQRAVAARGWYPPTKRILLDPSLVDLRQNEEQQSSHQEQNENAAVADGTRPDDISEGDKEITPSIHSCDHPELLTAVMEKKTKKQEKMEKESRRLQILKRKVRAIREKIGHDTQMWSKDECCTFLQFKKRKTGDGPMPKTLDDLRAKCKSWESRPSPNSSPSESVQSDTSNDNDKGLWV